MKFLLSRLLFVSINLPYGVPQKTVVMFVQLFPTCTLNVLDKIQKQVSRAIASLLATSLKPLALCQNLASFSLFYLYYFGYSSEITELVLIIFSSEESTGYSNSLQNFSVTISRCHKDVHLNSFLSHSLTLEFFACRILYFYL